MLYLYWFVYTHNIVSTHGAVCIYRTVHIILGCMCTPPTSNTHGTRIRINRYTRRRYHHTLIRSIQDYKKEQRCGHECLLNVICVHIYNPISLRDIGVNTYYVTPEFCVRTE